MGKLSENEIINNRYTVKKFIAKGGMGKTYLATDSKTGLDVALKVLSFSDIKDWKELELFEREINALKNLDHPNIPDYIDNFEIDFEQEKQFFLVQEYVAGKDLFEHIKSGKIFTLKEIKKIFETLCDILNYIHTLHPPIIHRDINPKNIILDESNKTYLVDFGAVGKIASDTIAATMSNTFVGTLGYMPPEQLYGKATPSSDLYSLGVTIIFLLTGKEPSEFKLKKMKLDYHSMVDIPSYLKDLLDKMIDPDDDNRMNNAKDVLEILKKEISVKKQLQGSTTDELIDALFKAEKESKFSEMAETINNTLDVNALHSDGRSILKIAFDANRIHIARFLIDHGADINIKFNGKGLLHDAVVMEKDKYYVINTKQFAELLLESGADVELKDNEGKTPLEYAYDYRSTDLKAIFSKYGAIDNYLEVIKKGFSHIPAKRAIFFNLIIKIYSLLGSNIKNSKKTAFLVGTLILLIIFYLFGYRSLGMIRIWGADSISTGIIISEKATSTTVNDVSVYKYYYKFKDKNNREFVNYSYTRGDRHHKNQKVKIEYLNSNPNFSILKDGWIGIIGNFFPFIFTLILLFVLIINFISFWIINNFFIVIKLLKKGIPVYAEIPIINSENSSNILYEYFDDINKVKKKGNIFTASDFVKNNHSVPCLYLPGNKHRSMLIAPDFINYKDNEWQIITNENLTKEGIKFFIVKLGISGLVFWFLYNLINYLINGV